MDALTHAVEAYTNLFAPKYTDAFAEKAVKLVFDNIEIFRDDGRAMSCVIFTEEIGDMDTVPIYNFTADNVVFRNITYTAAMKSKFSAANETNTVNVTVENVNFKGFNSAKHSWLMFEQDEFANVTYK